MAHSIVFGIETLGKGVIRKQQKGPTVLWDQVIGSVMGVLLGGPFSCCLPSSIPSQSFRNLGRTAGQ